MAATPPAKQPAAQPPADPPGAPLKPAKKKAVHEAWADMVDSMDTMSVDEAKALRPQDFGVHLGPIMDEKQFEAYKKARAGHVRVLR